MSVKEEVKAIFIGRETVYAGDLLIEGDNVLVKTPNKIAPFLSKYRPLISNIGSNLKVYQERILLDLNEGRTNQKVRIYPIDMDTFEKNFVGINQRMQLEYQHLTQERNFLFQYVQELEQMMRTMGNQDLFKSKFKDEHDFYTNLRPNFGGNPAESSKK